MKGDDYRLYLAGGFALMAAPLAAPVVMGLVLPTPLAITLAGVGGGVALAADAMIRGDRKSNGEREDG